MVELKKEAKTTKKAYSIDGADWEMLKRLAALPPEERANFRGIAGDPLPESIPFFPKTKSEQIYKGQNNTWIVLGRDRPMGRASGYINNTQAGAIDIVAGRLGAFGRAYQPKPNEEMKVWADPNFAFDAARIYISQKTDIDENFGLTDGKVGNAKTKSGIAIKADGVRIIAREGIKLVTRVDGYNSQGGEIAEANGIDLIATNDDDDLQPLVKGENLVDCLDRIVTHLSKLNGVVDSILMYQSSLNEALAFHTHKSPMSIVVGKISGQMEGWETWPSENVMFTGIKTAIDLLSSSKKSLMIHKVNLGAFKVKYFKKPGEKYINSRYNNTT